MKRDIPSAGPDGAPEAFELNGWKVDPRTGEASRGKESRRLQPRVMEVLLFLASRPGEVISKEEILEEIWRDTFVNEDALWRCIGILRKTLRNGEDDETLIETIPRRGYLLLAFPKRLPGAPPGAQSLQEKSPENRANPDLEVQKLGSAAIPAATENESRPGHSPEPSSPAGPSSSGFRRQRLALLWGVAASLLILLVAWIVPRPSFPTARSSTPRDLSETPRGSVKVREESTVLEGSGDYYRLGLAYYRERQPEDLERAIALLTKASLLDPESAQPPSALASTLALKFRLYERDPLLLAQAQAMAERAVLLDPQLAAAHKSLGLVHQLRGHLSRAQVAYGRAMEMAPSLTSAAHNRAGILMSQGKLDQAWLLLPRVLPPQVEQQILIEHSRIWLLYLSGALEDAEKRASRAFEVKPCSHEIATVLTHMDLVRGRPGAARQRLSRCTEGPLADSRNSRLSGLVELFYGSSQMALKDLEPALQMPLDLFNLVDYLELATAFEGSGQTERALRLAEDLVTFAAEKEKDGVEHARLYLARAGAEILLGLEDDAAHSLDVAFRLGYLDHRLLRAHPAFQTLELRHDFEGFLGKMEATARSRSQSLRKERQERGPEAPRARPGVILASRSSL